jgi:hypothetical protein
MGALRVDVMADEHFRKDLLKIVREQLTPVVDVKIIETLAEVVHTEIDKILDRTHDSVLVNLVTSHAASKVARVLIDQDDMLRSVITRAVDERVKALAETMLTQKIDIYVDAAIRRIMKEKFKL